jgi:alpha,alpha-trehalase
MVSSWRVLIVLVVLGVVAGAARGQVPATPSQVYPALYSRVEMQSMFADSKTFADATPLFSPATIARRYRTRVPRTRRDLFAFVTSNFELPATSLDTPSTEQSTRTPTPIGIVNSVRTQDSVESHIASVWPLLIRVARKPAPYSSLLYIPHPYVVPGGRFREFYYWDSYFTMLGLKLDGHAGAARGLVDDFAYFIDRYGFVPNGARSYYLSRSQPPFFYLMAGLMGSDTIGEQVKYLREMRREHAYWMQDSNRLRAGQSREHCVAMPDGSILNRYWDALATPRDESFREDVLLARSSNRAVGPIYRDIRSAAESGWDFSSRWLSDGRTLKSIRTTAIVPIDLNALLYGLERAIATACQRVGDADCERHFAAAAKRRASAMNRYLWDGVHNRYVDYDAGAGRAIDRLSAATLYPLFVGLAAPDQAASVAATVQAELIKPGGLVTTTASTGQQWDAPNGWPPLQWIAVAAFDNYGMHTMAHDLARRWVDTVKRVYVETGRILEKYDVESIRPGGGGEYPLQDGFGWTNGVTRALIERYPDLRSEPRLDPRRRTENK